MRERAQSFDPRQVMHTDTFEVFHYREPRPGTVEVHHHDFYEVYYLLSGQVDYWVDGRVYRLNPGDLLLINPMELHRPMVTSESLYERIVLWIHREFLESFSVDGSDLSRCFRPDIPNHIHPSSREQSALKARMSDLVREFYSREYGSSLSAHGLFLLLMVQLNRLVTKGQSREQTTQLSPVVQKALQYLSDHPGNAVSLEEVANACFVSKYYLSHTFAKEMGISVYRYGMLRRLLHARQLLMAGEPAGQVSAACGFSDYTSFYRAFKGEYGISPREFSTSP